MILWMKMRRVCNQHPVAVETEWLKELKEQNQEAFLLSFWDEDLRKPEPEREPEPEPAYLVKWFLKFVPTLVQGTKEGVTSEAPKQRLELILKEENLWQLDMEGVLEAREVVGLQKGVVMSVESPRTSLEQVQKVKDKFVVVLWISLGKGLVCGSLTNVTMPWRQRGQAIEPGGPCLLVEAEVVEQRYKAHCVQNSWSQPAFSYTQSLCATQHKY